MGWRQCFETHPTLWIEIVCDRFFYRNQLKSSNVSSPVLMRLVVKQHPSLSLTISHGPLNGKWQSLIWSRTIVGEYQTRVEFWEIHWCKFVLQTRLTNWKRNREIQFKMWNEVGQNHVTGLSELKCWTWIVRLLAYWNWTCRYHSLHTKWMSVISPSVNDCECQTRVQRSEFRR